MLLPEIKDSIWDDEQFPVTQNVLTLVLNGPVAEEDSRGLDSWVGLRMNGYIKQELVNRFPLRYCRHNFISSLVEEACLHSIFFIIAGGGDGCGKVSITRSIQQDTRDTIDFPST